MQPLHETASSSFPWITFLDYTLQVITVSYALLATAVDFKVERDGKKKLSRLGWCAAVFICLISLGGVYVKLYNYRQEQVSKAASAAQQKAMSADLALSLQTSLALNDQSKVANGKLDKELVQISTQSQSLAAQSSNLRSQNVLLGRQAASLGDQTKILHSQAAALLDESASLELLNRRSSEALVQIERSAYPLDDSVSVLFAEELGTSATMPANSISLTSAQEFETLPAAVKELSRQTIQVNFVRLNDVREVERDYPADGTRPKDCKAFTDCAAVLNGNEFPTKTTEVASVLAECQNGEPRYVLGHETHEQVPSVIDVSGSHQINYYCSDSAHVRRAEGTRSYRDLQDSLVLVNILTDAPLDFVTSPFLNIRGKHDEISVELSRLSHCKIGICFVGKPMVSHH